MPDRTQGGACLFGPKQHAVMFGLLAREICRHFGPDADALLLRAVETYGEERYVEVLRLLVDTWDGAEWSLSAAGAWRNAAGKTAIRWMTWLPISLIASGHGPANRFGPKMIPSAPTSASAC